LVLLEPLLRQVLVEDDAAIATRGSPEAETRAQHPPAAQWRAAWARCARSGSGASMRRREVVEVRVAGHPLEAVVDEPAGGLVVTSPVCELGLEERPLGTGEGTMLDEPVEQALVLGAAQTVQRQLRAPYKTP
jgi:hypothetical protein